MPLSKDDITVKLNDPRRALTTMEVVCDDLPGCLVAGRQRAHEEAICAEMREAGFDPNAFDDDLDPHLSQEIWDEALSKEDWNEVFGDGSFFDSHYGLVVGISDGEGKAD